MRDWYTSQYLAQVHRYNSPHGMEEKEGVNTISLTGWRRRRKGLIERNELMLTSTHGYTVHGTCYNLSYM